MEEQSLKKSKCDMVFAVFAMKHSEALKALTSLKISGHKEIDGAQCNEHWPA